MPEKAGVTGAHVMIAAAIIGGAIFGSQYVQRYQVSGGGPNSGIVIVDQITGEVRVCSLRECRTLPVER